MIQFNYEKKKDLKESIGKRLKFTETSMFGSEYVSNGPLTGCNKKRSWYAKVTMKDDLIAKVE